MLKEPLSYTDQVKKLQDHGMIISDEDKALDFLSATNYYRFTGYALQFRKSPNDSDFIDGTTFETTKALYTFDEELRDCLRKYIESAEVYYKTIISHEFSLIKCSKSPYNQHYNKMNYYNKEGFKDVINHFKEEKSYYKDSLIVKHHQNKYAGKMPLWVMVEMMSLSDVSKLYSCMYYSEQQVIADITRASINVLKNHLHCISVLRNKCAHAARLYNTTFYPAVNLSTNFLKKYNEVCNDTLFAYLIALVKRLPEKSQKIELVDDVKSLLDKYSSSIELSRIGFPKEWGNILINQIV